ncbi:MAG: amidohydrolase [Magnetovibrio sp.]|nr:amidohydrolase [Magnetovibrio sp.]
MSTNKNWLNLTIEKTLEPDLPICDPHHHLWEFRYERVANRYLIDEIQLDLASGHNIVSTVFIECGAMYRSYGSEKMRPVGETEFVNGIAAMSASGLYGKTRIAAGIVGQADLCLGEKIGDVLDAHLVAGGGRFRGIRRQANWDTSADIDNGRFVDRPHIYAEEGFREGFAQLAKRNLSFEAWCFHTQIEELIDLARAFPETTIILNHFGGPLGIGPYAGKRDLIFSKWKQDIVNLAACSNVYAKLGGINMEINGYGWHLQQKPPGSRVLMEATRPYYEHMIEHFGCERCMFESNFPVDMVTCSYNVLWNSFKLLAAEYGSEEKANLFHDTAARVYRI